MKNITLTCLLAGCSLLAAKAAPTDDIKAAVQKLADSANYTWTTTTAMGGGGGGGPGFGGPATGMTQKDGLTMITREFNGNKLSTVQKGDKVVRQNREGAWMTNEEMMAQFRSGGGGGGGGGDNANAGGKGGKGGRGRGGFAGMGGAAPLPAQQVGTLLASVKGDYMIVDGGFVGNLSPEAVTRMLTPPGFGRGRPGGGGGQPPTPPPPPKNVSGTATFWVADGALTKFELHVKGTVQGRNGDMDVDRTTTTEIKDVGTTKLDVPADAMTKLGA